MVRVQRVLCLYLAQSPANISTTAPLLDSMVYDDPDRDSQGDRKRNDQCVPDRREEDQGDERTDESCSNPNATCAGAAASQLPTHKEYEGCQRCGKVEHGGYRLCTRLPCVTQEEHGAADSEEQTLKDIVGISEGGTDREPRQAHDS